MDGIFGWERGLRQVLRAASGRFYNHSTPNGSFTESFAAGNFGRTG